MPPTVLHTPGPHESIAPNSDSKFEREHAFRILSRSLVQSIREDLRYAAYRMQHCWEHNLKKIRKMFLRSLIVGAFLSCQDIPFFDK